MIADTDILAASIISCHAYTSPVLTTWHRNSVKAPTFAARRSDIAIYANAISVLFFSLPQVGVLSKQLRSDCTIYTYFK